VTLRLYCVVAAGCAISWKIGLQLLCCISVAVYHYATVTPVMAEVKAVVRAIVVELRIGVCVAGVRSIGGVCAVYTQDRSIRGGRLRSV